MSGLDHEQVGRDVEDCRALFNKCIKECEDKGRISAHFCLKRCNNALNICSENAWFGPSPAHPIKIRYFDKYLKYLP